MCVYRERYDRLLKESEDEHACNSTRARKHACTHARMFFRAFMVDFAFRFLGLLIEIKNLGLSLPSPLDREAPSNRGIITNSTTLGPRRGNSGIINRNFRAPYGRIGRFRLISRPLRTLFLPFRRVSFRTSR